MSRHHCICKDISTADNVVFCHFVHFVFRSPDVRQGRSLGNKKGVRIRYTSASSFIKCTAFFVAASISLQYSSGISERSDKMVTPFCSSSE